MRTLITFLTVAACAVATPKAMLTATHGDGTPYVEYTGPDEIKEVFLNRALDELTRWAKEKSDAPLLNAVRAKSKKWERIGAVFAGGSNAEGKDADVKVGIEFKHGALHLVVYENVVFASVDDWIDGSRIEHVYYLHGKSKLRVTKALTLPAEGGFEISEK